MAEVEGKFDGILLNLAELHKNSLPELLKTFANFLRRKTEFFNADLKLDGEWEKLLWEVFRDEAIKADVIAETKRKEKEKVNKRRQLILKKKLQLERELGELDRELSDAEDDKIKGDTDKEKSTTLPIRLTVEGEKEIAVRGRKRQVNGNVGNCCKLKTTKKIEKPTAMSNKPKSVPSAFTIWFSENRKFIRSDNPRLGCIELQRRGVELWRSKSEEEKSESYRKAADAKKKYVHWKTQNGATSEAIRKPEAASTQENRTKRPRKSICKEGDK